MTAVGLLTALRYLLPGLAGIPCLLGGSNASISRRAALPQARAAASAAPSAAA